jgi:hypothetical protein
VSGTAQAAAAAAAAAAGVDCLTITSMCNQSAPSWMMRLHSSASALKSAARIDGDTIVAGRSRAIRFRFVVRSLSFPSFFSARSV